MATLTSDLRKTLEKTIIKARDLAEEAVNAAVQGLGVGSPRAATHLSEADQKLRRQLRVHARSLGDRLHGDDRQEVGKLIQEGAYEHWHRMLFARFLAENGLLLHPELRVGVTLLECEELAQEEGCNAWELAGRYASRMLPQIFRPEDPVLRLRLAPEHQQALEKLLVELPTEVFTADDSLGWVYQFWQAKRKDEVNASEVKIGAEELPAVTQLFTEDYMVDFLLHNSLGAWWSTRHPGQACPVPLPYLRTLEDGTPAAGKFEGWPNNLKDFTLLDPCCGSGHFLVAAFRLLVALRRVDEGLTAAAAVDAVLSQNLHGLELDARCVEIAVFALALAAWTTPGEDGRPLGVRSGMPSPAIACCGLKPAAKVEEWLALVPEEHPKADRLKAGLRRLHSTFQQAPLLGSLLDPGREVGGLYEAGFAEMREMLEQALTVKNSEISESALSAKGLLASAKMLSSHFNLVCTNYPFLGLEKQTEDLKFYIKNHCPEGYRELAVSFLLKTKRLLSDGGHVSVVMPSEWTFLRPHRHFRDFFLKSSIIKSISKLGWNSFASGIRAQPVLLIAELNEKPTHIDHSYYLELPPSNFGEKSMHLCSLEGVMISQLEWLQGPDSRIVGVKAASSGLLSKFADARTGMSAGDSERFERNYWEIAEYGDLWEFLQSSVSTNVNFAGRERVVLWEKEQGEMFKLAESVKHLNHAAQNWRRGKPNWGRKGIALSLMGELPCTIYTGEIYDINCCAIVANNDADLPALLAFGLSGELASSIRAFDNSLKVGSPKTILSVEFDVKYWQERSMEFFGDQLPSPLSHDPTQWIFHGNPRPATDPIQVALARLLGYGWPAEQGKEVELSDEARAWVARCADLNALVDDDGILPIPAMRGEQPAEGRLRQMLASAFGADWSTAKEQELLQAVGYGGKSLETWLREGFFEQHCKLFHQRPFIWQVWDGLRDGFSVLVNYHKLDRKGLESLTYSYLGDWINRHKDTASRGESGAQGKLEKALELQKKLVAILEGEAPFDIFVRWKPLEQQPIGWEPDLNDGVRLNIRPFMTAGILRKDPKIDWNKDRGTDVESAPWYHLGLEYGGKQGDRINDHHLSLDEKRKARSVR